MDTTGPFLNVAAFCENVIEDKSGVLSLIRLVDRLTVSSHGPSAPEEMPPTPLNWFLVLAFKSGSARGSVQVTIQPELPSGIRLEPIKLTPYFEGGNRGCNIVTRINIMLRESGLYWFRILVGDALATQIPLEVIYSRMVIPGPPSA
ncbi:MAG: hypothetical protein Q8O55_12980 [Dehalococcoidales bacterium]|nr:hypothetical protein [Dehalococcoidales bacterium]